MFKVKRVVALVLLLLVIGMGTSQVFAEGPSEMPGLPTPTPTPPATAAAALNGPELPSIIDEVIILVASLIP